MKVIYQANSYVVFHNTPFKKKKNNTRVAQNMWNVYFYVSYLSLPLLHFPAPLEDKSVVKLENI